MKNESKAWAISVVAMFSTTTTTVTAVMVEDSFIVIGIGVINVVTTFLCIAAIGAKKQ